jgi:hypothetical protein
MLPLPVRSRAAAPAEMRCARVVFHGVVRGIAVLQVVLLVLVVLRTGSTGKSGVFRGMSHRCDTTVLVLVLVLVVLVRRLRNRPSW